MRLLTSLTIFILSLSHGSAFAELGQESKDPINALYSCYLFFDEGAQAKDSIVKDKSKALSLFFLLEASRLAIKAGDKDYLKTLSPEAAADYQSFLSNVQTLSDNTQKEQRLRDFVSNCLKIGNVPTEFAKLPSPVAPDPFRLDKARSLYVCASLYSTSSRNAEGKVKEKLQRTSMTYMLNASRELAIADNDKDPFNTDLSKRISALGDEDLKAFLEKVRGLPTAAERKAKIDEFVKNCASMLETKSIKEGARKDEIHVAEGRQKTRETPPRSHGSIEDAGRAFDNGHYGEAIRLLIPLAKDGDVRAQMNLGAMFSSGLGVKKDDVKAAYWTRKAAEAGNPTAQSNLGLFYFHGRGVSQDDTRAAEWPKKASTQGNAGAHNALGYLFLEGRGVPKDYAAARDLFALAIQGGDVAAANNLAGMLEQGLGQSPDVKAALGLYEIAAKFGEAAAQNRLGLAFLNGEFRGRDISAARDWFLKSATQGDKYGQYHLGMLLLDDKSTDLVAALKWIFLSARQGYEPAESELKKRTDTLDESQKTALKDLVNSWRPSGRGAFDPGFK
jgi:TPR repeat protein